MLEQLERASTIEQSSETNYRYIKLLFSCCFTFWVCITSICFSNEQLLILWDQIDILYCTAVLVLHIHFCLSNNTYLIFFSCNLFKHFFFAIFFAQIAWAIQTDANFFSHG